MNFRGSASIRTLVLAACLGATATAAAAKPPPAKPDPRDAEIQLLKQNLDALTAKVEQLQAQVAAQPPAAPAPPPPSPAPEIVRVAAPPPAAPSASVTITAGKPSIQSADGRFVANLHGIMQFDAADYSQRTPGPINSDFRRGAAAGDTAHARDLSSGTNFRRARIGIDGKAFGDWDYNLLFDFAGAGEEDAGHIQELWIQYSGLKPFHMRIGAFPPSIGLEDQGSTNGAPFLERPAISDMARSLAGGDFREAAEIWAAGKRWYVSGAVTGRLVGVVNSQATGVSQPYDSALGLVGRAAFLPYQDDNTILHLGVHGSYVARPADTGGPDTAANAVRYGITFQERPELRVDGTRLISTGAIDSDHAYTVGLEAAAQYRNFFLQGELEHLEIERRNAPGVSLADPHFTGGYVEGTWVITGERRRYNTGTFAFDGPSVDHPFSLADGTWGAWELAGRYSDANLNYREGALGSAPTADAVRGGEQEIWSGGVNWYPNSFVRFMLDYQHVKVDRLSPSATTFLTPVGVQVGQQYHVISLRSQFAF